MKISFFKGGLRAFLLAALCLASCTSKVPSQAECYVMIDKTGSFTNSIDGDHTTQFLIKEIGVDTTEDFDMGITMSIFPLSNLRNNSEVVVRLPIGGPTEIRNKRLEAQAQFLQDCTEAITTVNAGTYDQGGSQIIVPLMRKLQVLCTSTADRKIFIIMSDLIEHTSSVSFYNAEDSVIRTSIDETLDIYAPNLSGVAIFNIYKPENAGEDALFDHVRTIWKDALTERGATFKYLPNL